MSEEPKTLSPAEKAEIEQMLVADYMECPEDWTTSEKLSAYPGGGAYVCEIRLWNASKGISLEVRRSTSYSSLGCSEYHLVNYKEINLSDEASKKIGEESFKRLNHSRYAKQESRNATYWQQLRDIYVTSAED